MGDRPFTRYPLSIRCLHPIGWAGLRVSGIFPSLTCPHANSTYDGYYDSYYDSYPTPSPCFGCRGFGWQTPRLDFQRFRC